MKLWKQYTQVYQTTAHKFEQESLNNIELTIPEVCFQERSKLLIRKDFQEYYEQNDQDMPTK